MAPAPPPPLTMTVGEVNSRSLAPRAVMWAVAVYLPSMFMVFAAAIAHWIYSSESVYRAVVPIWWLPPLMLWGVYMAVVSVLMMYTYLFLPRAPSSVPEALVNVGMGWIGLPLGWVSVLVACLGQRWMAVAWTCLMVAIIAAVIVF